MVKKEVSQQITLEFGNSWGADYCQEFSNRCRFRIGFVSVTLQVGSQTPCVPLLRQKPRFVVLDATVRVSLVDPTVLVQVLRLVIPLLTKWIGLSDAAVAFDRE